MRYRLENTKKYQRATVDKNWRQLVKISEGDRRLATVDKNIRGRQLVKYIRGQQLVKSIRGRQLIKSIRGW